MDEKMRAEFEAWITSLPYEKPVTINPESSGWPGQYRAYEVQLAWEAWQASRAELVVELPQGSEPGDFAHPVMAAEVEAVISAIESAGVRVKP